MGDISGPGFGAAVLTLVGIWSLVVLLVYVWYLWAMARLFPYLGLPAAHGWFPVYNQWRLLERGGYPGWLILLGFVPGVNIVAVVFLIMAIHRINKECGEGVGMTVLGALIAPLWATLLGSRLQARGHSGGASHAPQAGTWQASQQNHVEYGSDGQIYPLLGGAAHAPGFPDRAYAAPGQAPGVQEQGWTPPPAPPLPPQPFSAPAPAPSVQGGWVPAVPPAFETPSPAAAQHTPVVPPAAVDPQAEAQAVSNLFADPVAGETAAQSHTPGGLPGMVPSAENPWSLGSTIDGNFERLASEALPPRDANFGGGADARPFSWPQPQPAESFAAPAAPVGQAAPVAPVAPPVPPVMPAVPVAPPTVPTAVPVEPELPAALPTVTTDIDDDLDHTIMVSRRARWALELSDGAVLELEGDDIVLGRRPSAIGDSSVLTVPDTTRTLSKSHARLRRTGEEWTVEDLNSTNGVFTFDESGAQVELAPGIPTKASEQLIIGTLEVRLRPLT